VFIAFLCLFKVIFLLLCLCNFLPDILILLLIFCFIRKIFFFIQNAIHIIFVGFLLISLYSCQFFLQPLYPLVCFCTPPVYFLPAVSRFQQFILIVFFQRQ